MRIARAGFSPGRIGLGHVRGVGREAVAGHLGQDGRRRAPARARAPPAPAPRRPRRSRGRRGRGRTGGWRPPGRRCASTCARMPWKPPMPIGVTAASAPPASITSAMPLPDVHDGVADRHRAAPRRRCTTRPAGPRVPSSIDTYAAPMLGISAGTQNGENRSMPFVEQVLVGGEERVQAADARADRGADAVGLGRDVEPRVLDRLAGREHGEVRVAVGAARGLLVEHRRSASKSFTSQAILTGESDGVELRDRGTAGPALAEALQEVGHAGADRVHGADSGDHDPPAFHATSPSRRRPGRPRP